MSGQQKNALDRVLEELFNSYVEETYDTLIGIVNDAARKNQKKVKGTLSVGDNEWQSTDIVFDIDTPVCKIFLDNNDDLDEKSIRRAAKSSSKSFSIFHMDNEGSRYRSFIAFQFFSSIWSVFMTKTGKRFAAELRERLEKIGMKLSFSCGDAIFEMKIKYSCVIPNDYTPTQEEVKPIRLDAEDLRKPLEKFFANFEKAELSKIDDGFMGTVYKKIDSLDGRYCPISIIVKVSKYIAYGSITLGRVAEENLSAVQAIIDSFDTGDEDKRIFLTEGDDEFDSQLMMMKSHMLFVSDTSELDKKIADVFAASEAMASDPIWQKLLDLSYEM